VRTLLVRGVAGERIVELADAETCDAIVVGAQTRGGVPRLALGSVAGYVVAHAPCTAVVARPPREWGD
jgi:nucleotide-binding universal stress UspA family protein